MLIKRLPAGVYAANCYIIMEELSKECAIIDAGGDAEDIESYIVQLGAKVKYLLLTHGHSDHTGGVGYLSEKFNTQARIHKEDGLLIKENGFMFGPLIYKGKTVTLLNDISESSNLTLGSIPINVIETPGHTPGGVCFRIDNNLFTGDTLFLRSIGRTDLSGGNFDALISSIRNKLFVLPDELIVYPGHGPSTSIKYEKENNPFL